MRFAASDDRAAIRIDGRIIALSPAPRARELFPFTFADWRGSGLTVRIRQVGAGRSQGTEAFTSRATLTVGVRGSVREMTGVMSCGS